MTQFDAMHRIKWTLLATLGWSAAACGGALSSEDGGLKETSGDGDATTSGDGDATTSGDGDSPGSGGSGVQGGSGGSATQATGGRTGMGVSCTNPANIAIDGKATGFIQCEEGYRHRESRETCPNLIDKNAEPLPDYGDGSYPNACASNADCEGELSYCTIEGQIAVTTCVTGCATDDDCSDGFICECGSPIGACRPATCSTDDDCGEGLCASDDFPSCGAVPKYGCTTAADACLNQADCGGGEGCELDENGRACQPQAVCGRPFLVRGQDRKAPVIAGQPFSSDTCSIPLAELNDAERQLVQDHYLRAAQMEHASIAAFARFTLQLLQLGAPADLIQGAGQAQLDETRHARLCFSLANHYGASQLGPAGLDLNGAMEAVDLEKIVELCVLEGCVGESIAACEAAEAGACAKDPELKKILSQIADDELNHAALSYRFVSWAISQDASLKPFVKSLFARLLSEPEARAISSIDPADEVTAAHGVLSNTQLKSIRARALATIVGPCAEALLSQASHVQATTHSYANC